MKRIQGLITLRDVIFWLQLPEEFIEIWAVNNQDRSVGCTWGNPTTLCGNIIAIIIDIYENPSESPNKPTCSERNGGRIV